MEMSQKEEDNNEYKRLQWLLPWRGTVRVKYRQDLSTKIQRLYVLRSYMYSSTEPKILQKGFWNYLDYTAWRNANILDGFNWSQTNYCWISKRQQVVHEFIRK